MTRELSEKALHFIDATNSEAEQLLEDLCLIPAPSNHEEKRAEFCRNWLLEQGAEGVYIDDALNVLYPVNCEGRDDIVVFMAHTDTVFPDTEPMPFTNDGTYFYSPGVGDDTACLVNMLMSAKYVAQNKLKPNCGILFAANSGEEGLGNLKGIRQIMKDYAGRIAAVYTFDGRYCHVVNECVGSHRYRITVTAEGGHSFGDFGNKSAIHGLSQLICNLYNQSVPQKEGTKTTFNAGVIEGGTSVNTIAQKAVMLYEYRSDCKDCLAVMKDNLKQELAKIEKAGVTVETELIGERPCTGDVDRAVHRALVEKCVAVQKKHSGGEVMCESGSTDCNIPMSLGIPAVCVGTYEGSGAHTREEKVLISSLPIGTKIAAELILDYFTE